MSSYRVTLRSIANFDSLQTILVDYILMPVISLVMFLLIAFNSTQDYTRILIGTAVTTGIATGIGVISTSSVYDQNIGIIDDVISIRPSFIKYWIPKFVIAGIAAITEVVILGLIGLFVLGKINLIWNLILGIPFIVIILCLLGYFGSILGMKKENPYWLTNFLSASLVILSGVIIPVSKYPLWLKVFADLLPISNIINWIINPNLSDINLIVILIKLLVWWIICAIAVKLFLKNNSL